MQWKDSEDSVESNKEEPEAFYEEEYSPLGVKAGAASAASRRFGNPIIWIPAIVVVIILLYIFLPTGNNTQDKAQLSGFDARLDQLEKRMLKLESVGERVLNLEKSLKDNGTIEKRLDRLEASLAKRMDQVDKELLQLRKQLEAKPIKKSTPPPATQQKKTTTERANQHVVKKGETLYSISRKYGLSVEQLRKKNGLDKNSVIHVGQKLTVE
ncbi:MAG: LysM domain-containing protein [Thermodesulfobacteriota bacterium]